MAGHPDWAGTALVHGMDLVASGTLAIPANTQTFIPSFQFSKNGYVLGIEPEWASVPGTVPFASIQWRWLPDLVNPDVGTNMLWTLPVRSSGIFSPVTADGPVRGPFAQVAVTNLDPVKDMTMIYRILETTRHIARDDWRDNSVFWTPPAGFSGPPNASPAANQLAGVNVSIAADVTYLLPLYAGQAWLSYSVSPVAGGTGRIQVAPFDGTGDLQFDSGPLTASSTQNSVAITLPRKPCTLFLAGPASGFNYTLTMTIMEYAS